jgi:hypothetical protein|tara:strand:- start:1272 stop:1487 length:216 start_codon:yes stop_codon:yes gene_type:complete
MNDDMSSKSGSYIVRDKRGTYMSGYSSKLGEKQAQLWARDCAKRSKGVLYFRKNEGEAEEEIANYLVSHKT